MDKHISYSITRTSIFIGIPKMFNNCFQKTDEYDQNIMIIFSVNYNKFCLLRPELYAFAYSYWVFECMHYRYWGLKMSAYQVKLIP